MIQHSFPHQKSWECDCTICKEPDTAAATRGCGTGCCRVIASFIKSLEAFQCSPLALAYPFNYLLIFHSHLLSTQLGWFVWLLSWGQLGSNFKTGASEAVTGPLLTREAGTSPVPLLLGKQHQQCPAMAGGCVWQLLLCWAVPGQWFSSWRPPGTCCGWNCEIRDLGFICGYTVACVCNSRFLLKRADWRHSGWDSIVWLLSLPTAFGRAQTSICLKKRKQATKTPPTVTQGVFLLALCSSEVKFLSVCQLPQDFVSLMFVKGVLLRWAEKL